MEYHEQPARLTWRSAQVCDPSDALKEPVFFVKMEELRDDAKGASVSDLQKSGKADGRHLVGGSCAVAV